MYTADTLFGCTTQSKCGTLRTNQRVRKRRSRQDKTRQVGCVVSKKVRIQASKGVLLSLREME
jgi:hypothetical protein